VKQSKSIKRTVIFTLLIFLAAFIGLPTAHGYLHPADPLILLAAILLPTPYALAAAGIGSLFADVLKGYVSLAPVTLLIKLLMVAAAKGLLRLPAAKKHPECMAAPAAMVPVIGYYLAELLRLLFAGSGGKAFLQAAGTLQKDLVQAAGSVLLFILIYDFYKGIKGGRAEIRHQKELAERKNKS